MSAGYGKDKGVNLPRGTAPAPAKKSGKAGGMMDVKTKMPKKK